jgi:hypothetical protein
MAACGMFPISVDLAGGCTELVRSGSSRPANTVSLFRHSATNLAAYRCHDVMMEHHGHANY